METEVAVSEIFSDPFEDCTPRKSQTWYDLRKAYLAYKVDLKVLHERVPLDKIERNANDGGKWRWDTPLFDKEVDELITSIRATGKFEAVWLKYDTNGSTYSVLDGHHRIVAWKKMGHDTVPAVVVSVSKIGN